MTVVIIMVILIGCAIAFFLWMMNKCLTSSCPSCKAEGNDGMPLPVIPGLLWWCPNCNEMVRQSDLEPRDRQ